MCKIFRTFAARNERIKDIYTHYMRYFCCLCADKKPQQELTPWGTPVGEMELWI